MADEPAHQQQPPPPSATVTANANAASLGHNVIPIVNKLQDIFAQLGSSSAIELPQVAVVGSQSSGKSSVLEALVGRDFLPRGSNICTRRPLVLQLLQIKRKPDGTDEEYGEFLHLPGKRFYDFNQIRREIQAETEREAGGNKGVSDKQIRLKIFSPNVLDITLVDLPGITKVAVGDQPSDIESRIRTMIMSYIKLPTCVILAVTPANSDLANSDALQIAGNADPDGFRTIGVITKLDIMDRGTNACGFLMGKVIPLRLGYIGVVNRSQEDIMLNRSIKDALVAEEKFFQSRPVYNELADRCGVPQLAKKLNQILVQHIKKVLPGLKSHISATLVSVAKEHASYGEITESKMDYINSSHPNFIGGSKAVEIAMQQVKSSRVSTSVQKHKDAAELDKTPQSERNSKSRSFLGRQGNGVVTEQQNQPGSRPVGEVEKPKSGSTSWGISSIFGGSTKSSSADKPFSEPVHTIDYMDYSSSTIHLREPPTVLRPSDANSDQQAIEIQVTKLLLRSYYDIVRKNIEDYVPKAIMHFLVNHTKKELHNMFIKKLYRDDLFEQMLQEPDDISIKRKRTRELLHVLQQAFRTLDELPLDAETVERGYKLTNNDPMGLPNFDGFSTSSTYPIPSHSKDSYNTALPNNHRSPESHSGEWNSPFSGHFEISGSNSCILCRKA